MGAQTTGRGNQDTPLATWVDTLWSKDLISLADLSGKEILALLRLAREMKAAPDGQHGQILKGKALGLVFQKPSLRTRVSFEVGMAQLGGRAIYLSPQEIQLGERESAADAAAVLSRYLDGIVARTFLHRDVVQLARHSTVPVINGLSDQGHPCQILADLMTMWEHRGTLEGQTLAFIGDGNNVAQSLLEAAPKVGLNLRVATPPGYEPEQGTVHQAMQEASRRGTVVMLLSDPIEAARGADILYTDVWYSMGEEAERDERMVLFPSYQINGALLVHARSDAIVMHCLPAHRGEEITDEVLDGPQSVVLDQAENRLHAQKALLCTLLGNASHG